MNSPQKSRPKRILYWAGPAEIEHLYTCWSRQRADSSYFGCSYLEQFFGVCQEHHYQFHLISTLSKPQRFYYQDGHTLEFRPPLSQGHSGIAFHIGEVFTVLSILLTALSTRSNLVIISQGRPYWFLFLPLKWLGYPIIPSMHCVLWPKSNPHQRNSVYYYLFGITRYFFRWGCAGIMTVSHEIAHQVRFLSQNPKQDIRVFIPNYPRDLFRQFPEPNWSERPFRIIFVGRVETNKGVYLIPKLAQRLCAQEQRQIHFDVCGNGSQLDPLKQEIESRELTPWVTVHGYCDLPTLSHLYGQSHLVFVPTQKDFVEGFNKVVAEGVLAHRPVLASSTCPSAELLQDAVVVREPDDLEGYYQSICQLYEDEEFYREKQRACTELQEPFYDLNYGWGKTLEKLLRDLNF